MKLAILGGSFNPVHIGHLILADAVLSDASLTGNNYERVILVPAYRSPFKIYANEVTPHDRLDMLSASIVGDPRLAIDPCEINREGVSYTVDTLQDIISRYRPDGKPGLVLGDDLAASFHKWKDPEKIAEMADIIIARRRQTDAALTGVSFPFPHKVLSNDILNVSSQMIREKISQGKDWFYLVPQGARHIITERGLYGLNGNAVILRIENETRLNLSPARFAHSRNTALTAWDICGRFGLNQQDGYLAGIAHDFCKDFDDNELIRLVSADGEGLSKLEQKKPRLLHARAAAVLMQEKYGINNKDILEAIRYHTTGVSNMCCLAKAVYIADKIEPGRSHTNPALRELAKTAGLEELFSAVLHDTVDKLKSRQLDISRGTMKLLAAMNRRNTA